MIRSLTLAIALALASTASAKVYQGKGWSESGPVARYRLAVYPVATYPDGSSGYYGTVKCTALTPGFYCLLPYTSAAVVFAPDGSFYAILGNDVCEASGFGSPRGPLNGSYECVTGDTGTFYLRRVR
jgi:hypothetical protein